MSLNYSDEHLSSCSEAEATRVQITEFVFAAFCQSLIKAVNQGFTFSEHILDYPQKGLGSYQIGLIRPKKAIDKIVEQVQDSIKEPKGRGRPKNAKE